jgi:hypothetical protein
MNDYEFYVKSYDCPANNDHCRIVVWTEGNTTYLGVECNDTWGYQQVTGNTSHLNDNSVEELELDQDQPVPADLRYTADCLGLALIEGTHKKGRGQLPLRGGQRQDREMPHGC